MNSENKNNLDGETSRNSEESSSNNTSVTTTVETVASPPIELVNLDESILSNTNQDIDTSNINSNIELPNNIKVNDTQSEETTEININHTINLESENLSEPINNIVISSINSDKIVVADNTVKTTISPITTKTIVINDETEEMKRASAKKLIERYFYQLLDGCGRQNCKNKFCASSGEIEKLTPNQAAARAIQLFSQDAKLCDAQPTKIARTIGISSTEQSPSTSSSSTQLKINNEINLDGNGDVNSVVTNLDTAETISTIINCPTGSLSSNNSCSNNLFDSQEIYDINTEGENCNFSLSSRLPRTSSQNSSKTNNTTTTNTPTSQNDSTTSSSATTPSSHSSSASASGNSSVSTTTPNYTTNDRLINNEQILNTSKSLGHISPKRNNDLLSTSSSSSQSQSHIPTYLDEDILYKLIEECQNTNSYSKIMHRIGEVFSSAELLIKSFRKKNVIIKNKIDIVDKIKIKTTANSSDIKNLKKEDLRTLEGDLDKDEDSSTNDIISCNDNYGQNSNTYDKIDNINDELLKLDENDTIIDIQSFRRSMEKLFTVDFPVYEALNNALHSLSILLSVDLRTSKDAKYVEKSIHVFVMIFELMTMALSEFLDIALPNICRAAAHLPPWAQAKLAKIWAENCKSSLRNLLQTLQQLISIQAITCSINRSHVEDSDVITSATKILKIVYYANILAGKLDSPITSTLISGTSTSLNSGDNSFETIPEDDDFYIYSHVRKSHNKKHVEDKLGKELGLTVMDCRIPLIPFEEFYNEPLSDTIEMDNDYLYYKNHTMDTRVDQEKKFTFMLYSFILTPATKVIALYYDSRIRMYSERRMSLFHQSSYYGETNGAGPNPYLKLKVRRDQLIDDALVELEMIAMGTPKDFKKQLVVEFVGEQGIDEGGVSKEFFQLVIEEIFNPDFGMFIYQEDSKTVWFNSTSFENEAQFTLIGIVLGLAIYNNIILAVNFPMVVYRKLMGGRGTFYDLQDWNPVIFNSLKSILDYDNDDMEDVFMQTFKISYTDVFGNTIEHDLKDNGGDIMVNQNNKLEFIELYSDYLLNVSIERQFKAFKKGFEMVTDESPLKLLFRSEEIELLVCGSRKFDFIELEKSTEYEGGYTDKSQTIIDFWNIVHGLPMESKRKLLEFTTGSDRVPVGGLSRLKLVIARNGPDSDRLPTSHTCFNVLLLPEYETKEKLEDRLLKAINYSKGFGML